jgi:hypothetical protein
MRFTYLTCLVIILALPTAFAAPGAPPPKEPNCLAVYNACTGGGYIQGDAKEGNGLWKDCIIPLMTGTTPPKSPPAGVTFPNASQLTQQIQTCHKNHPKWGMGR